MTQVARFTPVCEVKPSRQHPGYQMGVPRQAEDAPQGLLLEQAQIFMEQQTL